MSLTASYNLCLQMEACVFRFDIIGLNVKLGNDRSRVFNNFYEYKLSKGGSKSLQTGGYTREFSRLADVKPSSSIHVLKGCDSNFEIKYSNLILKVATNETTYTLHYD